MIFGRDNHHNWFQDMDRVFIDGTFTLAPLLFSQVLWFLPSVQNTCFPWCTLCYPTNAKKHTMDHSDLSKRYGHFSSSVDLSRLWDGSYELCSTSISTCRTSWMSIPPDEKYEAPAFRERSSAMLQCWTTVCPPCQNDNCARVCTNWQFGRRFWCFIQLTAAHPELVGRHLYRSTWT